MIEKFIQELESKNMFLIRKEDKLILKGKKGQLTPDEIQYIKENGFVSNFITENKEAILQYLDTNTSQKKLYKLSPLQSGILFHELYDLDSKTYNSVTTMDFPEGINQEILKEALELVIRKHSILRTSFITDKFDIPVQQVHKNVHLPYEFFDFRTCREIEIDEFIQHQYTKSFDMAKAPLMRFSLIQETDHSFKMVWVFHHLILDGWSIPLLFNEILDNYSKILNDENVDDVKEDNYEDYIKYLSFKNTTKETLFWKKYFEGITTSTLLPFISNEAERNKGGREALKISLYLDQHFTEKLKDCARKFGVTPNTLFQGAWAILLSKYTVSDDTVFGVVISGRSTAIADIENRIGIYINTLPLRIKIDKDASLQNWLAELQKDNSLIRENEGLTIGQIQQEIGIKNDFFDTIMVFQNYPKNFADTRDDAFLKVDNVKTRQYSNFPLTVSVNMSDQTEVFFHYNASLLDEGQVEMIKNHFGNTLSQFIENPNRNLGDIDILTLEEKQKYLRQPESSTIFQNNKTVIDYFEEQAALQPESPAVFFNETFMTYKELNVKSNKLAHYLKERYSIQPEDIIGIIANRSHWYIVAILAVLKSGAAYLPIDAQYPKERKKIMVSNSGAKALIIESEFLEEIIDFEINTFSIDLKFDTLNNSIENLDRKAQNANSLAYVIYTSGSSGTPKGVLIEQKGLLNLCHWHNKTYDVDQTSRATVYSGISFDASVWEIFPYLIQGACLFLINDNEIRYNTDELQNFLLKHTITHSYLPTQVCIEFIKSNAILKTKLLTGGESLIVPNKTNLNIYNNYGPTENTVVTTFSKVAMGFTGIMPIGKPIANISVYIVDKDNRIVPEGVTGELCIGGYGLARGYINEPLLTEKKFVMNPNIIDKQSRMYKTGDMAKWLPNGNIMFNGRVDDQIKIRGFRVELQEIEIVLNDFEKVSQCHVTTIEDQNGNKRLIALVVPVGTFNSKEIGSYLKDKLPAYMVPTKFIEVDSIPLTINDKIDKKRMVEIANNHLANENNYVGPRDEIDKKLIAIWKKILEIEEIGIFDNFFELGGHSLLATKVINEIKKTFGLIISVRDVFNNSTIMDLNYLIQNKDLEDDLLNQNIELEKESVMEIDFSIIGSLEKYEQVPKSILLTGATGFIGSYVLHGLLKNTQAAIYCLVRNINEAEGKARIEDVLKYYHLFEDQYSERIIPVAGDLSRANIGIEKSIYQSLSAEIDYIFHIATYMDHFSSYGKLKSANVSGNVEIVKFALQSKQKKVIYTSTLGNYTGSDTIYEHHARNKETHLYGDGYSASKWVGEEIMNKAASNGLEVQVFRIGLVTGDFASGRMPKEQWFPKLLKSCYEIGMYTPEFLAPILPVDFVSNAIVSLAFKEHIKRGYFHLSNQYMVSLKNMFEESNNTDRVIRSGTMQEILISILENSDKMYLPIFPFIEYGSDEVNNALDNKHPVRADNIPALHDTKYTLEILRRETGIEFPDIKKYYGKYLLSAINDYKSR